MKRRFIAGITAGAITCAMFGACAQGQSGTATASGAEGASGTAGDGSYTLNTLGEMPLVLDGTAEFSILCPWTLGDGKPPEDNWGVQHYEEMTGVHVNWQIVPADGWKEKRSVTIASGNLPDYIAATSNFGESIFSDTDLLQYGTQGLFVDLKSLMDDHSIHMKKILAENPIWDQSISTLDGKLYGFPDFNECFHCNYSMRAWINVDWLDNLGLAMPTTTEELKQVLIAFKEQDANGNGDPGDEIPMATSIDGWNPMLNGFLMNAFTYTGGKPNDHGEIALDENKQIYFAPTLEEYRNGLRYLADLYANGLIAPESFTQDNKTLQQTNESGEHSVIGVSFSGVLPVTQGYTVSEKFKEYDYIPPLEGPDGVRLTPYFGLTSATPGLGVITSAAKDPGLIMRWIDYMYSEEGTLLGDMGQQGVDWRPGEEGEIDFHGNTAKYFQIKDYATRNRDNACWQQTFPSNRSADYRESMNVTGNSMDWRAGIGDPELLYFQAAQAYQPYEVDHDRVVPMLSINSDKITDFTLKKTGIEEYVEESVAGFITGSLSLDNDWDSYLEMLERLGLQEYLQICQEAYDEKYA